MTHSSSASRSSIKRRALSLLLTALMVLSILPAAVFSASAAASSEKPWQILGVSGEHTYQFSDGGYIAHLPYYAQASQFGSEYDCFVAVDLYDDAVATHADDTNFGSALLATKPMYAFLGGKTYSRSVGSAYIQDTNNTMTFSGNSWAGAGNMNGSGNTVGTISSYSSSAAIRISAGKITLNNVNVQGAGGSALALTGGTATSISGNSSFSSGANDAIALSGGAKITTLSPTGTITGGSEGNAVFLASGSGSSIGTISSGTYTSSGSNSALHIQAGNTVSTISGGTFTPGSIIYFGLDNKGTIGSITGGTFYGFSNTGTITNGISGGTFDFRTHTASSFSNINGYIASGMTARLDSTTGNGKFTIVSASGLSDGTYIGNPPIGTSYVTGTFGGYTTYIVGNGGTPDPDPEPDPDPDPDPEPDPDPIFDGVDGYYVLVNKESGKVLNVPGSALNSEATCLTVYSPDSTAGQRIKITASGNYFQLAPMNCSNRVVSAASASNNAYTTLKANTTASTQLWQLEEAIGGYIIRSAADTGYALAEVGAANGAAVRLAAYNTTNAAQIWSLAPVTFDPDQVSGIATASAATGYSAVSGPKYTIAGGGTLTYTMNMSSTSFNKYHISFYSSRAVSGTISYIKGGTTVTEPFYLENTPAGTMNTFDGLIDSYLSNGYASYITRITITAKTGINTDFALYGVTTEKYTVYASTVYIENSNLKVGALLTMGGGISYIEDKQDGNSSISNLLNRHDTGRLVQQSYYAGNAYSGDGYSPSYYGSQLWGYNPVQGGSTTGAKSKIVDVIVTDDTIYIKCMPRDWATGLYAYSYMENVYKLTASGLQVDNRFFDWSGYSMNTVDQEMPAFYVISNLSNFTWYSGSAPWTNGAYTTESSLPFWGEVSNGVEVNSAVCRHYPYAASETWCAWTNSSGRGIGIYTPGVTQLFAGRYSYNGSTSATNGATNYVAPLRTIALTNYSAFEYSYIIATGTLSTIRSTFYANKNIAEQSFANVEMPATASIETGKSIALAAEITPEIASSDALTWTTSNANVATVDNGVIKGISTGTATITATTVSGVSTTCAVTVSGAAAVEQYIVTYTNSKGENTTETVDSGTLITLPIPTTEGYSLKGWYCMADKLTYRGGASYRVTADVKFVATWTALSFSVFYTNDGTTASNAFAYGTVVTLATPSAKVGYTFGGWLCNDDNVTYAAGSSYTITKNVTFTAQWTQSAYTVTFTNNSSSTMQTVNHGSAITLSTPVREGYTFGGWLCSADSSIYPSGTSYTVTASVTFTAQWTLKSYTVSYVNGTTTRETVNHGAVVTLTTPVKEGYTFDGWLCSANNEIYASGASYTVTAPVTFTAQWLGDSPSGTVGATVTFGHSMSLENRLSMAFLVRTDSVPADATDIYMEVCRDDVNNGGKTAITTLYTNNVLTDSALRFYYDGIAAAEMSSVCYAKVYYTSGGIHYVSQEDQISVKAWAEGQLAKAATAANLKTLLVDMLNYGASAQTKFGVATGTLANAGISAYQYLGTKTNPSFVNVRAASGTGLAVATNLQLENAIEMVFKVPKANADAAGCTIDNMVLKVTRSDTHVVTEVPCSNVEASAYSFNFSGMATSEFGVAVTAQLFVNGQAKSILRTFSIESYLATQYASSDAATQAMFNAMKNFSNSAAAYFGA